MKATGLRSVTPTTTRFGQNLATLASLTQATVRSLPRAAVAQWQQISAAAEIVREN